MDRKNFTTSLGVALVWSILLVLAYLPYILQRALVQLLVGCWLLFAKKEQRNLYYNLELVMKLPRHSSFARRFARQNITAQYQLILDTITAIVRPQAITLSGFREYQQLLAAMEAGGHGNLAITAHLGSWELACALTGKAAGKAMVVLAKNTGSRVFNRILERLREIGHSKLLWTDDPQLGLRMAETLQRGEWLGFAMDQKPAERNGPIVDFMGQPTPFVVGAAVMARRHGCSIISIYCVRTGPRCYELQSRLVLPAGAATAMEIAEITQLLASDMTRAIRLYPEQWCWNYKRWTHEPSLL
jgi:lauroyl/myristoyl acyltransferase